jgi:hypothetical protein
LVFRGTRTLVILVLELVVGPGEASGSANCSWGSSHGIRGPERIGRGEACSTVYIYIVYKIDKNELFHLIFINKFIKFFSPRSTIATSL